MIESEPSADDAPRHTLPSNLIHDLRTPLSQIIGYSEMIVEQMEDTGQVSFVADLQKVRAAAYRLLALMNANFLSSRTADEAAATAAAAAAILNEQSALSVEPGSPAFSQYPAVGELASAPAQGFLLVVDDVESNREVLRHRLMGQGYAVATAENGRHALEMLRADIFDLVLLDIMMPEMDGYEVLQHLKADDRLRHIPVIMISALTDMDSIARCIELGAEDYLSKPFDPILLKARVSASLEKKRARDREMLLFEQLQQNYERLKGLEKQRDDLTNMIVHDLRTPLTSVIAGLETLEGMGDWDTDQREVMSIAMTGGESLLGMINDLLEVEKLESGAMRIDHSVLSLDKLVGSAVGQVASLAARKQLTLLQHIPPDLPPIQGDEGKLRRTLVNLLGNAIKATPAGGTVTVDARCNADEHSMVFSVTDTGEGIPADAFDRIFEKFGQVETRQSGQVTSTGLGLTFCRLAVEAHKGHINVESELGQGSTFRITIPLGTLA